MIEMLKERATIPALLEKIFGEQTRGQMAFCPFHHNTKTRAFHIRYESRGFYCYGCGAGPGDAIQFVRLAAKKKGMEIDFQTAVHVLATIVGIKLDDSPGALLAVCSYLATQDSEPVTGLILTRWAKDRLEPLICNLFRRGEEGRKVGFFIDETLEDLLWPGKTPTVAEVQGEVHSLLRVGAAYLKTRDTADDFEPDP